MAKRPTPIERAIAGEPIDRKGRYEKRLADRGIMRLTVMVPRADADQVRTLAAQLRASAERRDD